MARLKTLDPMKARGIQTAPTPLEHAKRKARPSGKHADPRRTLSLDSAAWKRLRARILAEEPLCRMCDAPANVVDHASGDPSDNSRRNLVALCEPCHNHKTQRQRAGLPVIWGCDADGWPRDPMHGWNREATIETRQKSLGTEAPQTARPPSFHRNGRG